MSSLADWTNAPDLSEWKHSIGLEQTDSLIVQQLPMDDLVRSGAIPLPDFIKCDVEGGEFAVFSGGKTTLDRVDAPLVLFEANARAAKGFGLTSTSAKDFLTNLEHPRFKFFELQEAGNLAPLRDSEIQYLNILAVPESKSHRLVPSPESQVQCP